MDLKNYIIEEIKKNIYKASMTIEDLEFKMKNKLEDMEENVLQEVLNRLDNIDIIKKDENKVETTFTQTIKEPAITNVLPKLYYENNNNDMYGIVKSTDVKTYYDTLPKVKRFAYGIENVDKLTGGFAGGELIVITGYTKNGKTEFLRSLTYYIAKSGIKILWFSYEEPTRMFLNKFKTTDYYPEFYLTEMTKAKDLFWLETKIKEAVEKYGVGVVFIDHLHYVVSFKGGSTSLEIGEALQKLNELKKKYNITIFLVSHTTKAKADDHVIDIADIRDSSFIPQEADSVYAIQRLKENGEVSKSKSIFKILAKRQEEGSGTMGSVTHIQRASNGIFISDSTSEDNDLII